MRITETPYSEGVWTPVLTFATPGDLAVGYTAQVGTYEKIGNQVTLSFSIVTSSFVHGSASGDLRITGSPFTSANNGMTNEGKLSWGGITSAVSEIAARIAPNSAIIDFRGSVASSGLTAIQVAGAPTGASIILVGQVKFRAA